MMPFAVVGSDKEYQVNGKRVLGRKTAWGIIEGGHRWWRFGVFATEIMRMFVWICFFFLSQLKIQTIVSLLSWEISWSGTTVLWSIFKREHNKLDEAGSNRFKSRPWVFLHGVSIISLCMCGSSLGTPVFSHSLKIVRWTGLSKLPLNCPSICWSVCLFPWYWNWLQSCLLSFSLSFLQVPPPGLEGGHSQHSLWDVPCQEIERQRRSAPHHFKWHPGKQPVVRQWKNRSRWKQCNEAHIGVYKKIYDFHPQLSCMSEITYQSVKLGVNSVCLPLHV